MSEIDDQPAADAPAETEHMPSVGEDTDESPGDPFEGWPAAQSAAVIEEAARQGLYKWELYAELSMDPTGLSLPILMEELFWGCAGIGLSIVMPALALAAIRQAATDEQLVEWAPQCFGTPGDIKLAALAVTEPSGGSDVSG